MDGSVCFLILLAAVCLLSGPIALIVSIVTARRVNEIENRIRVPQQPAQTTIPVSPPVVSQPMPAVSQPIVSPKPAPVEPQPPLETVMQPEPVEMPQAQPKPATKVVSLSIS